MRRGGGRSIMLAAEERHIENWVIFEGKKEGGDTTNQIQLKQTGHQNTLWSFKLEALNNWKLLLNFKVFFAMNCFFMCD